MRRIGSLAIAVAAFGLGFGAQANDQVTLRLNWILYGFHTPFHLGVDRGYYKDEGIDLTIGDGQGSGRTVQVVAAGGDTFGISDAGSVIAGASKGAPIRSVMAVSNSSPYAVGVRGDLGAKSAKDLTGMTIAATAGEAGVQLWPAILAANGMARLINIVRGHTYFFDAPAPKVIMVSPPPVSRTDNVEFSEYFEGANVSSTHLAKAYSQYAEQLGCGFFDAGTVAKTTPVDGVHLDAENTRAIGRGIAPLVRRTLDL